MVEDLSTWDSDDSLGSLRKVTLSVPAYLGEGFMMSNSRDRQVYFYGELNSLEEFRKGLPLTEQCGQLHGDCIHKIKNDISELNRMIG